MNKDPALSGEQWCYHMARCLLQQGKRDHALVMTGELWQSTAGRPFALRLIAEIYGMPATSAKTDANACATVPTATTRLLQKV
ncbi:MAG: hypothetical protein HY081_08555 [Gammaproteobacteria bacterium]|nr:hypothetical protein [Gammaproteobacteria bacterium]